MAEPSKEIIPAAPPRKSSSSTSILHIVYGAFKKVCAVAAIYLVGYFNFSAAWFVAPVILSVVREEWKKTKELKRNIAKAAAMSNEKDVILARIDELPAWVFFPDVERAEWLNKILRQVWPNVNHYAKELIKGTIEPNICLALAEYKVSSFSFQKMRLGTIPPRIGGIKVYDYNVSRTEIIMDIDIFYAGDCDISFTMSGLSGGIKDFQIHGLVRVVMKPLITTMPLVGGLQIFFLNNPAIDFNLVGVADILDMPGLSDLLRRVIVEQVAAMMVLPNKLPILLSDAVPAQTLKFPEPQGVLRVHVVEAKHLMKKDISVLGKGKSDPYAIITVGAQQFKTKTIDNTVDPKWDFWCEFPVESCIGQNVNLQLFDHDDGKKDSNLGRATIEVNTAFKKKQTDTWVSLEEAKTGMVHVRMQWLELSDNLEDLKEALAETQQLRLTSMSTAILMVFVDSVKNLPNAKGVITSKPDPLMQLSVCKVTQNSNIVYRTDCPVYEQGFTFLVNNPETDTLHVKIVDQKTQSELGKMSYNLSSLLDRESLQLQDQPLQLHKSGPDSKIILSLKLKILKFRPPPLEKQSSVESTASETINSSTVQPVAASATSITDGPSQDSAPPTPKHEPATTAAAAPAPNTNPEAVEDVMIAATAPPKVESAPTSGLHHRTVLNSISAGNSGLGRIQVTLRYSVQRQRLIIVVHKIVNLPLKDPSNIPDPYVKLYLLPERSKDTKRKTETIKDNCNPVFDETFEYVISQAELNSRQLEVTVLTQKTWKSPVMGQVIVDLGQLDLSKAVTSWYDLEPHEEA
ncbi:extended synaptotagmin-like protein 2 isoform X2 [Lycorma delicatula]|uniref:extended synaptotagmin-like protein 2 isoform X2 n=1 Tax=Lycorma delicatula TaxID=130591 RepID=UPI003F50DB95